MNFINIFGEDELIDVIDKYKDIKSPSDILPITNPVARFLKGTTYTKYGHLYSTTRVSVPNDDFMYFKLVAVLLKRLEPELGKNTAYKAQIMKKLLHRQYGSMLSALNELLAAAYYKYIGLEVELNSSKESGAADIDIINTNYATDAKLYPNNQLRLEAIINESAKQLLHCVRKIENSSLLLSVFIPDKKLLHQALSELDKAFDDPANFKSFTSDALHAMPIDDDYMASDYSIRVPNQNVNIFIQQNWALDDSIEEMKLSIEKATKQAVELGKEAIPWIMVPGDANRHGITVQVLRHMAGFHPLVMENKSIYVMPVLSFGFEGSGFKTIFDVYQTGANTLGINSDSFQAFMESVMNENITQY